MKIVLTILLLFTGAFSFDMPHTPRNIQSPHVADDFWAQWSSVNPRMCMCVKVTSKAEFGSEVVAFTSNTRDMTLPGHSGVTFKASPSATPTLVEQALDEPTNMEITAIYNSDSFDQTEVLAGKWNFAEIEVFSTCWDNVNLGELLHFRGNLGEFKDYQTYFTAEARGLISRLSQDVDFVTQRSCRALKLTEFHDVDLPAEDRICKHSATTVVINGNTYNVVYTGILAAQAAGVGSEYLVFNHQASPSAGELPTGANGDRLFVNGKIKGTSGANNGVSREIAYTDVIAMEFRIGLKRTFPFPVESGDTFTLKAGCNGTIEDCIKWGNVINRRAEDYVPTLESITRLPPGN